MLIMTPDAPAECVGYRDPAQRASTMLSLPAAEVGFINVGTAQATAKFGSVTVFRLR